MTRYHVEFDIASDHEWHQGHNLQILRAAPSPYNPSVSYCYLYVPKDAVVTELPDPIKVGDVLTTTEQTDACPDGTVLIDKDGDAWKRCEGGHWTITGSGRSRGIPESYLPYTVAWLPRAQD